MTYLIAQLWLFLLLAGLIGSVLGWVLRGGCKRPRAALKTLQSKYQLLEKKQRRMAQVLKENSKLKSQVGQYRAERKQQQALSRQLTVMQKWMSRSRKVHKQANLKLKKTEELLAFAKRSILAKDSVISELKGECSGTETLLHACQVDWEAKEGKLQERLVKYQQLLKEAEIAQEATTFRLQEKESRIARLMAQIGELEQEQADVVNQLEALRAQHEAQTSELERVTEEKEAVVSQMEGFKQQAESFIQALTEESRKQQETIELMQGDIEQIQQKYFDKEEEAEKSLAALGEKEALVEQLSEKLKQAMNARPVNKLPSGRRAQSHSSLLTNLALDVTPHWKRIKRFTRRRR